MKKINDSKVDLCSSCLLDLNACQVVVSRGSPSAKLMVVGEAPGAEEEKFGKPFVGRSGKLLDKLLTSAGIDVVNGVYFCNVIKCRPPKNRKPKRKEILEGIPWLMQQMKLVDPFVVILLGTTAVEAVLGIKGGISSIRGNWFNREGRFVMPLFHPSYLLRNPSKIEGKPISLTEMDLAKVSKKLEKLRLGLNVSSLSSERMSNS